MPANPTEKYCMKIVCRFLLLFVVSLMAFKTYSHGLVSAASKIELRPNNLVEIQVQFDFIKLLNYRSKDYALPVIASLPKEKFGLLYVEVIKLFDKHLEVKKGKDLIALNKRYPSQERMFDVIKKQFIENKFSLKNKGAPYTFSDRRYYQVFNFDFKISEKEDLNKLRISFPKALGNIDVTYSEPTTKELHKGEAWRL